MIPVTKPFLPPFEEYQELVRGVFERNWLTNDGPLVRSLESKLTERFNVPSLFVSNGTIAIQLAIKALGLKGKIITTSFSYIATTSSIVWEGCEPVFVDIEPNGFNIDASKIEAAITPDVTGIIATHCFGIPCDVHAIQKIADKHNLKVIYDAAHAFGTTVEGKMIYPEQTLTEEELDTGVKAQDLSEVLATRDGPTQSHSGDGRPEERPKRGRGGAVGPNGSGNRGNVYQGV